MSTYVLNTLPWVEVTLGITAALAILVVYDVIPSSKRSMTLSEAKTPRG